MTDQQYDPVKEHPPIEVEVNKTKNLPRCERREPAEEEQYSRIMKCEQSAGDGDTGDNVKSPAAKPVMALNAVTAREPENERRCKRPEITGRRLYQKLPAIADWLLLRDPHHEDLGSEEESDDRPHSPDQSETD